MRAKRKSNEIPLSPQQIATLNLLKSGRTRQQMAVEMNISYHTLTNYLSRCYERLEARNSAEAVVKAIRAGIIDP